MPDGAVGVVVIKGAQQAHLDGGTFYATRQDYVVIGSNVQRFHKIKFAPLDPRYGFAPLEDIWKDDTGRDEVLVNRLYSWSGESDRLDLACWSPGTDYLTTIDPGHGFVVTSLYFKWIGDTSSSNDHDRYGHAGSHWFAPGYSLGDWNGDTLPINLGVSHSHGSPGGRTRRCYCAGWGNSAGAHAIEEAAKKRDVRHRTWGTPLMKRICSPLQFPRLSSGCSSLVHSLAILLARIKSFV